MKFTNLFSSSKGNSLLVQNENTNILIDAGLPGIHITNELKKLGVEVKDIDAIVLTHEHSDHMRGIGVLSRKGDIPVYVHEEVEPVLRKQCGKFGEGNVITVREESPFFIKDMTLTGFDIPHDAIHPMGFIIEDTKSRIGIATDMGIMMQSVTDRLKECSFVFLEANHDEKMLKTGPYPYALKKRILSSFGHLSNDASGQVALELIRGKTERIRLGHLSEQNNLTSVAYSTVKKHLENEGAREGTDYRLDVANRYGINETVEI